MNVSDYCFTKGAVFNREGTMYRYLNTLGLPFLPKFYGYDKEGCILTTQRIYGHCLADYYGDCYDDLPARIKLKIKEIITDLYKNGIVYPNITGYNFIEDINKKIWLIGFKHSFGVNNYKEGFENEESDIMDYREHVQFVKDFCFANENNWNPYFA